MSLASALFWSVVDLKQLKFVRPRGDRSGLVIILAIKAVSELCECALSPLRTAAGDLGAQGWPIEVAGGGEDGGASRGNLTASPGNAHRGSLSPKIRAP